MTKRDRAIGLSNMALAVVKAHGEPALGAPHVLESHAGALIIQYRTSPAVLDIAAPFKVLRVKWTDDGRVNVVTYKPGSWEQRLLVVANADETRAREMKSQAPAIDEAKQVARPLKVLVSLIKDDLQQGREASERASMPYYKAAGEKMLEAKASNEMGHSELLAWIKRNFGLGRSQALVYMAYADATSDASAPGAPNYKSLDDFRRRHLGHDRVPGSQRDKARQEPVRADERDAQRKLALQLVDIGYKTLATTLHPDKGGSRDAMARLNQVRERLKKFV